MSIEVDPDTVDVPPFMKVKDLYTEYASEILETFFQSEARMIVIKKRSDQMHIRPMLVNTIQMFTKQQQYKQATLHLGIHILDVYMDNYILSDFIEHQKLIGIICLLLAAKSEDLDEYVPSIKDILRIVDMSKDLGCDLRFRETVETSIAKTAFKQFAHLYCKLEFLIFESLEFNTIRPTAITFINIFENLIVTQNDLSDIVQAGDDDSLTQDDLIDIVKADDDGSMTLGDMRVKANKYIEEFQDAIVTDTDFFNVLPSRVAAAIIGATRKLLKIGNYWNKQLMQLTRYRIEEIRHLMIVLIDKRFNCINNKLCDENDVTMKDSGYVSPGSLSLDESSSGADEEIDSPTIKKCKTERPGIVYCVFPN